AWPHNGLFSQYAERPWSAYSWGFEVAAAALYGWLGLRSVPVLLAGLKLALAAVTLGLARPQPAAFWRAAGLAAAALYAIAALAVRPVFVSMIFFGVLLQLLSRARRSGDARALRFLPLLFLLWANVHIQFVYGLLALALFCAAVLAEA